MTTQPDVQKLGEDYLEHYGKMGMRWGHRGSKSKKPLVSRRRATSYAVAGTIGAGGGALGLLGANKAISRWENKPNKGGKIRRTGKSTVLNTIKIGSTAAGTILAAMGAYTMVGLPASQGRNELFDEFNLKKAYDQGGWR